MATLLAALFAVALIFGGTSASGGEPAAPVCGDVNDTGSINTTDALLVLK